MRTNAFTIVAAAVAGLALTAVPASAVTIFADDFSGDSSDLNGAAPDVGAGTWIASNVFNRDGSVDPNPGSATLAFTPAAGNIYHLDASLSGVTGDGNWFALGFGAGQSTASNTSNRFINNLLIGKAWMLFRGNDDGHQTHVGSATSGTVGGLPWAALANVTGAIDMRIELDTTGGAGSWEATWFAKLPTDTGYTEVRAAEVLQDETINSVGIALANTGVDGTVESFSLTLVPEPSAVSLLGIAVLGLLRRRR